MRPKIRIATYNIFLNLHHWDKRLPMIVDELNALDADIVCIQEVVLPQNTIQEIVDKLKATYHVTLLSRTGSISEPDDCALAIISKLKPIETSEIHFGSDEKRVALRATFKKGMHEFDVINTHLYWKPYNIRHARIRLSQVKRLISWAQSDRPVVICGDMNATPRTKAIRYFNKRGYRSAHKLVHGKEPRWTCANPVDHPERTLRDRLVLHIYNIFKNRRFGIWRGVLDYVLISDHFKPTKAGIFGDQPSPAHKRVYPSDHLGVYADLTLPVWRKRV